MLVLTTMQWAFYKIPKHYCNFKFFPQPLTVVIQDMYLKQNQTIIMYLWTLKLIITGLYITCHALRGCCRCNNCEKMEDVQESVFCKEVNAVCRTKELKLLGRNMEIEDVPTCLVDHSGFQSGCLGAVLCVL